eukprot:TRINITY_DN5916_c0_g1_i1.p1 TRINITY_DN5916_c0_g1~~TRINITY_DN5916_c0_g1_i1.p1  ORF type:complete len:262 (+),score=29.26 TRINITY_DN5916_c0_g1_i1:100-786(+)
MVQFHPSYSYEDFVEGYRPINSVGNNQSMNFQLVPGPLKDIVHQANLHPNSRFIMVIDELNRGNVAKIFGELFYLLEYRGKSIRLQYSSLPFSLPDNLFIIATMNTVDRSLARLDKALRRRFFFVPFMLDREPVSGLLLRWLNQYKPDMRTVDTIVKKANQILSQIDNSLAIGPSHFMTSQLSQDWLMMIWKYSIVPEVEDAFEDIEKLTEFAILPEKYLVANSQHEE